MKKLLFLAFIFFSYAGFCQYPVTQVIGSDSTIVNSKGSTKTRLINIVFTDTAAANIQRIKQYPGAQIFTASDNKFWLRNSNATAWLSGSTTIINIDSVAEGELHLYFTTQRVRGSLYGAAPILYDSATGTFSLDTFSVTGVATKHDLEKIDTAVISVTAYQSGDSSIILVEKKGGGTNRIYLVAPPLPAHTHPASDIISGILPIVRGGTGIGIIGLTGQSIRVNPAGTGLEYYTPAAGNSGTITNIATTGPITGGPITSTGTIGFDTTNHHTKQFYDVTYGSLATQNTNTTNINTNSTNIATNTSNIALKQNLVTLSTTGTTGAATFNQGTGALNIPSYSGSTTSYQIQTASGSTAFTFTGVPASIDDYMIFVNGSAIRPTTDYTTAGNVVTVPTILTGDRVRFQRIK